ncbi:MAG: gluconate 2-dehydrogenase subunit 3 family protein, partial [Bryobacteraceae bacterium]
MSDRREALKIIGAIGTTCAFPFASDELYGQQAQPAGQHAHAAPGETAPLGAPKFFAPDEIAVISRIADLIIPETDTPGAVAAGVPLYIDLVVSKDDSHQQTFRNGLDWLSQQSKEVFGEDFLKLTEEQQISILTPLCKAADMGKSESDGERFFRAIKSMTADGYYTSRIGLTGELGFKGGAVLAEYPACTH